MTGHVLEITSDAFESLITDNNIVFVDFWAEWCAPCKQFAMVYESVAKEYSDIVFSKVNIEHESQLAELFSIRSIPHLMVFKSGIAIYSEAGSMPQATLQELVQQAINADVSHILKELDEDKK